MWWWKGIERMINARGFATSRPTLRPHLMLPAPLRPLTRPRAIISLIFLLLFILTARFYLTRPHGRSHVRPSGRRVERSVLVEGVGRVGRDWVELPDGVAIPPGLDIDIDMQTHKKRIRLPDTPSSNMMVAVSPESSPSAPSAPSDTYINPLPQRKWERIYESQHRTIIDQTLTELSDPSKRSSALEYLWEHAGTVDVGAGMIRSPAFPHLLELLKTGKTEERLGAAEVLFACLHNNPDAVAAAGGSGVREVLLKLAGDGEDDDIVLRRLLSSLLALIRGQKSSAEQILASLSQLIARKTKVQAMDQPLLSRTLTILSALLTDDKPLQLAEEIIGKHLARPYADWMTHEWRPWCKTASEDGRFPAVSRFCGELNADPTDTSLL